MATAEAFAAVAAACLEQIAFHAPRVHRDGGVEDVHRMRVAVRRLRAVLSVFRRAIDGRRLPFEDDLRWLQDKLGAVRDWDVFRAGAVQPIEGEHNDVALVDEAGGMARDYAHLELRIALESARAAALWKAMMRWLRSLARGRVEGGKLDRPIAKYARRELRRRDRKLRRRGRRIAALDEEELHTLRIGAKKLRYAAEFFCDLYPEKKLKRVLARIKGLQDLLGGLNDARTARTLLDRLEPRRGARPARDRLRPRRRPDRRRGPDARQGGARRDGAGVAAVREGREALGVAADHGPLLLVGRFLRRLARGR